MTGIKKFCITVKREVERKHISLKTQDVSTNRNEHFNGF